MKRLVSLLKKSRHAVAFTGAGVSTFSGIRDFRGKNGLYSTSDAEKIFDIEWFFKDPSIYYNSARDFIYNLDSVRPSIVHEELARLEKLGLIKSVITQNIDLLHQKAGSKRVIELHGSPDPHRCIECGKTVSFSEAAAVVNSGDVPCCKKCGGVLKPDIIFFGEQLPAGALSDAIAEAEMADLLLVLGSTLLVQPAASIPLYTLRKGGKVVIINNMDTPFDDRASLRYTELGEVFRYISGNI